MVDQRYRTVFPADRWKRQYASIDALFSSEIRCREVLVKGHTEPIPAWKYRGSRWKAKEVSTMEGILFGIGAFASPFTVLFGLVALLAIDACGILLGHMADEEASGKAIFWAESPFTDVSVGETPAEGVRYLRAA